MNQSLSLLRSIAIMGVCLSAPLSFAQDTYFIEHKPTNFRFHSCSSVDGTPVVANATNDASDCAQWRRVPVENYFYIQNERTGKNIRPATAEEGAAIEIRPESWRGAWTQWSYEDRGDGFGHLINRATGKHVFAPANGGNESLQQRPSSWRGNFTRWRFVQVGSNALPTPTEAPTSIPTANPTSAPTANPTSIPTALPTAPPEPSSATFEAESGVLSGNAATFDDGAASGGQGVAFIFELGDSLSFTNVPASDSLTVRYATENPSGQLSVAVNGTDIGNINFAGTGAWVGIYAEASINVSIPSNATVEIYFDTGDAAVNIDTVTFSSGGGNPINPTPNPTDNPTPSSDTPTPPGIGGTPLPVETPSGNCNAPVDIDPPADLGEGYAFGMTTGGLVYHNAIPGHNPGFAILGIQGAGAGLPETGPFEFTDTQGNTFERYEIQVDNVVAGQNYTLEIRLQGDQFGSGQCVHTINVQPGQGEAASPCFITGGGGVPVGPAAPQPSVDLFVTNADAGLARLIGGSGSAFPGHALYTTTLNCTGACLDTWPMLTVADPEKLIGAGGVTGTFSSIPVSVATEDDCGNQIVETFNQVTYNGEPLYFFANDTSPVTTAGASISGWDLAEAQLIPQLPLIDNPMSALPSPRTGGTPGSHGFVFDLNGSTIAVRGGIAWQLLVHPSRFVDGVGSVLTGSLGNNDLQMWCSNNQIQWHMGDLDPVELGRFEGTVPGSCYGDYYYFFRFEKLGPVNNDPGSRWTYSGLFTTAGNRVDPNAFPSGSGVSRTANWFRFRHPHAQDGNTEAVFDAQHNSSRLDGLARFESSVTTGGNSTNLSPGVGPIRIEALENGAIPNFVPVYNYNTNTCCGTAFSYGNVISYEITAVTGGIDAQTYNTHQHIVVGDGYNSPLGDPRLTLAGAASTNMVFSDAGSHIELEKNAVFTQHVITLTSASQVDNFLRGHHVFHGVDPNKLGSTDLNDVLIGNDTCGRCHFRDGRSSEVFQTPAGPRIAPPVFGVGLLQHISTGGSARLTWEGNVATVEQQVANALRNDHGVNPGSLGSDLALLEDYTKFLTVPNRQPGKIDQPGVAKGQELFHEIGCADCHQENQRTSSSAPSWARNLEVSPFSDMRTHNIGTGGTFRTAPLWGLGTNIDLLERNGRALLLLHDGRATSLEGAIGAHGGAASSSRSNFNALSGSDQTAVVDFLKSL